MVWQKRQWQLHLTVSLRKSKTSSLKELMSWARQPNRLAQLWLFRFSSHCELTRGKAKGKSAWTTLEATLSCLNAVSSMLSRSRKGESPVSEWDRTDGVWTWTNGGLAVTTRLYIRQKYIRSLCQTTVWKPGRNGRPRIWFAVMTNMQRRWHYGDSASSWRKTADLRRTRLQKLWFWQMESHSKSLRKRQTS